jgi:hypothetical protein
MTGRWFRTVCLVAMAGALLCALSCARAPSGGGSGLRLVVTLRFAQPVRDIYQYFFLIRNAADSSGTNGPVPTVDVPYGGNGFATGLHGAIGSFTDFVAYGQGRQLGSTGYGVYHVPGGINGDPSRNVFFPRGEPISATPPGGGTTLLFELDLNQIQPDVSNSEPDPNNGQLPRYLQINAITTTTTPVNTANDDPTKVTDAFGDQSTLGSGSFNQYITIDTAQVGKVYQSTDPTLDAAERDGDTFSTGGATEPAVDMVFWSVQVVQR